ncbi:MAG: hypothetical protein SFU98_21185 [Leptospiraceae bacterium]|nr:hypothetical protein [Leptospiraceae bacterium]
MAATVLFNELQTNDLNLSRRHEQCRDYKCPLEAIRQLGERSKFLIKNLQDQKKKTSSTLRIPKELMEEFEAKIQKHESIDQYLRYLLRTFRLFNYSGMVPNARKVKTEY